MKHFFTNRINAEVSPLAGARGLVLLVFSLVLTSCARQTSQNTSQNGAPNSEESKSNVAPNQIVVGQFLDGQTLLSLRLKELSSDWKRIQVNQKTPVENQKNRDETGFPVAMLREISGAQDGVYFTQWKTVAQNNDTFLVCYRAGDFDERDLRALFNRKNEYSKPSGAQFMGAISLWLDERPLDFVLINLKNVKVIGNARAVNWTADLETLRAWAQKNLPDDASLRLSSRERLQLLANATLRFARDHDGVLPTLSDEKLAQNEMSRLVFDASWWRAAENDAPFVANARLSRKKIAHISAPRDMILWYQRDAAANGNRNVAFLDGSTRELGASDWEKYRKGSKIKVQ